MPTYKFNSHRPLLEMNNIMNNDMINTDIGTFSILSNGRKAPLRVDKYNNKVFTVNVSLDKNVANHIIKLKIEDISEPISIHDPIRKRSFYVNYPSITDFLPDHRDEEDKPIQLVVENPELVENANGIGEDKVSFCVSLIHKSPYGETQTDGCAVERSTTSYEKVLPKKIDVASTIFINLNFVFV